MCVNIYVCVSVCVCVCLCERACVNYNLIYTLLFASPLTKEAKGVLFQLGAWSVHNLIDNAEVHSPCGAEAVTSAVFALFEQLSDVTKHHCTELPDLNESGRSRGWNFGDGVRAENLTHRLH